MFFSYYNLLNYIITYLKIILMSKLFKYAYILLVTLLVFFSFSISVQQAYLKEEILLLEKENKVIYFGNYSHKYPSKLDDKFNVIKYLFEKKKETGNK